jgi:hypothetical protein
MVKHSVKKLNMERESTWQKAHCIHERPYQNLDNNPPRWLFSCSPVFFGCKYVFISLITLHHGCLFCLLQVRPYLTYVMCKDI